MKVLATFGVVAAYLVVIVFIYLVVYYLRRK